jgi:hypothetical protein
MKKGTLLSMLLGGIWGAFQPTLFPSEEYGNLWLITAIAGGVIIGIIVGKLNTD